MLEKIKALEAISSQLEPSTEQRKQWNAAVQNYADQFLDDFNTHTSYVVSKDMGKPISEVTFTEQAKPIETLLALLKEHVDTPNLNPASGGHFGYIPGGGLFTTALGDYLAAVTNRYAGIFYGSPGAVRMENFLLRWMCTMVGYPEGALGNLTSGGSIANLSAITTARDAMGIKARDIEHCVIYMTHQVHHCLQKSLRIAGMEESIIRYIPMDNTFKMQTKALENQIKKDEAEGLRPFMVVGSAGTTDTGAIDPLARIGRIAKAKQLWFHVDAAYGGFFMLSDTHKSKFVGIEQSDSLAIDPHKGLFLSYGIGALLIKNTKALYNTHRYTANYMQDIFTPDEDPSPADLSPELTKHFRGLRMWLSLQLLGIHPFRAALDEKVLLCQYFYKEVQKIGFQVGPEPDLSICIFRYVPSVSDANAFNKKLLENFKQEGSVFLSSTTIDDTYWIRLAVLSFRTHLAQVNLVLQLLKKWKANAN